MARLNDTILGQKGYGLHQTAPMIDLRNGGQFGPQPTYPSYVSTAAYVKKPLIALVLEAPRGFQMLDSPDTHIATFKSLIELHPQSIDGMVSTLNVETVQTPFGGAGEMLQDPSDVKRDQSVPVFNWRERYGKPISNFMRSWITNLIMDPATKYPAVISHGARPADILPDFYGATVLFMEPDATHSHVLEAWVSTNFYPQSSGEITARRDLTQAGETADYSITFSALTQTGDGVREFAQSLIQRMDLRGMNPNQARSHVRAVSADVAKHDRGYVESLVQQARSQLPG